MKFFKNIFDTNEWITNIGTQINDCFTKNGLLISEDITFIESIISSQNDFQFNDCKSESFLKWFCLKNCFATTIMSSLGIGIMWYSFDDILCHSLFSTLIYSSLLTTFPIAYSFCLKFYLTKKLLRKANQLNLKLKNEKNLLKKYFKLIEDNEVIEMSEKHANRLQDMKILFRRLCWNSFSLIRQSTIQIRNIIPLKTEIDNEINFLCCLPSESFDKLQTEDQTVLNLNLLKSLMQLTRLQQSEFLRRIICVFMSVCYKDVHNFNLNYIFKKVTQLFDHLILETNKNFIELYSAHSCSKSFWICSEKSLPNHYYIERHEKCEKINLINMNRSARKHLLTALSIVDNCDDLIENGIEMTNNNAILSDKFEMINKELKCLNDLVINFEKLLKIRELKELKKETIVSVNSDEVKNDKTSSDNKMSEDFIVTDQVFEAYIPEDSDEEIVISDDDYQELCEYRIKLAQEAEDSQNLYRELIVALKPKAVEHKIREAKALGIEFDDHEEEDFALNLKPNEETEELYNEKTNSNAFNRRIGLNLNNDRNCHQSNEFSAGDFGSETNDNQSNFALLLAQSAVQRGKMFGLSTECEFSAQT